MFVGSEFCSQLAASRILLRSLSLGQRTIHTCPFHQKYSKPRQNKYYDRELRQKKKKNIVEMCTSR
ncbi:hypothetical protein Hanom_Chr05g00402341 [Helianthus anomalus]